MNVWELVTVAVESIRNNKLRSFLTTLGIVIGIAAVIAVVAIGQGGRAMLMKELEKLGSNTFYVYVNYREGESTNPGDFTELDVKIIKQAVPEIQYLSPLSYSRMKLRGTEGEQSAEVIGTNADFGRIGSLETRWGRYFTSEDDAAGRRVAVLDEELAQKLFGRGNPVGRRLMAGGSPLTVVGVLKKEEMAFGFDSPKRLYLPYGALKSISPGYFIHEIQGSTNQPEQVTQSMERVKLILERRHRAIGHYIAYSMEQDRQSADKVTGIMTMVISAIAGISLVVGGIGVMNIMLVSVTERTREIGIRMALGARRRDILLQFLVESVVLCIFGGVIGIILGYGGAWLVAMLAKWPPLVSLGTVAIAFIFSACVGIFFGIYPANRAAGLDPIEALRRD